IDEKSIQMGVGKQILALVDHNQKNIQHIENGNCELVTVIECVSADKSAICPSIVFKGAHCDLEWGQNNLYSASISHSPNGWTDQELGSAWLE
ncbi:hypothetical protein ARMSODRAFT_849532, partial [Armillaria solidipes]